MGLNKKILIHSIVFSPDGVSTAYLYNDIAKGFRNAGYDVIVLTTTPHYNIVQSDIDTQKLQKKWLGLYYISTYEDIKVYHVNLKKYKNTIVRLISFIYWHIMSFILAMNIKKIDIVLAPSPPLTIGLLSVFISKLKNAVCVYNVQEIYPDFLIKHGKLNSKFVIRILNWMEEYIYQNCKYVITIDSVFHEIISNRISENNKFKIIPNFVDTEIYKPIIVEDDFLIMYNFNPDALKLMYAGNIGHAQDWIPIIQAAKYFNNSNKVQFIIIGEGVNKKWLENEINNNKLDNIILLPYQDRILIPKFNSVADLHFICMNETLEEEGFPSKIYTIMSCAKPAIVTTGINTPLYNFLKDKNCTILISENRTKNFINSIKYYCENKHELITLGANARKMIIDNYSKEIVINQYLSLLS